MSSHLDKDGDVEIASENTLCPGCKQKYGTSGSRSEAKLLKCLDTFCIECLEKHIRDFTTSSVWSCQRCQTPIDDISVGVGNLKTDPVVELMLKIEAITTDPSSGRTRKGACDACLEAGDGAKDPAPYAEVYCEECNQKLCKTCYIAHGKLRPTKSHKRVVVLGSQESKNMAKEWRDRLPRCNAHKSMPGDFYCKECKEFLCSGCSQQHVAKHKMPCVIQSSGVAAEMWNSVRRDSQEILTLCQMFRDDQDFITKQKNTFADNISATKKEITERAELLHQFIESHKDKLIEQLETIHGETDEAYEEAIDGSRLKELRTERFIRFAELMKCVDLATFHGLHPLLKQRGTELKEAKCRDPVQLMAVKFTPGMWQQPVIDGEMNCLGSIAMGMSA